MKEKRFLIMVVLAIVMLNIILFVLPIRKTIVFYMADFFIVAAGVLLGVSKYLAFQKNKDENTVRSRFFGWPIFRIGLIGFFVTVAVNIILIFCLQSAKNYLWIVLVVNVVIFGMTGWGLIESNDSRDFVKEHRIYRERKTEFMKSLRQQSSQLVDICSSAQLQGKLKQMAEEFRYSDPNTEFDTAPIEEEMQDEIKILETLIETDESKAYEQIDKIQKLLKKRNRMVLLGKNKYGRENNG